VGPDAAPAPAASSMRPATEQFDICEQFDIYFFDIYNP
jgi:hypothetical protein